MTLDMNFVDVEVDVDESPWRMKGVKSKLQAAAHVTGLQLEGATVSLHTSISSQPNFTTYWLIHSTRAWRMVDGSRLADIAYRYPAAAQDCS